MALIVSGKRVFKFKKGNEIIDLADPNQNMTPSEVMEFYSNHHTELLNGEVKGPEIGDDEEIIYHFSSVTKTKG